MAKSATTIAMIGPSSPENGLLQQPVRPQDAKNIVAKIAVCVGAEDPIVPAEQRAAFEKEMREGNADWQLHLYGGVRHAFTNPALDALGNPALKYDSVADARSWATMMGLLDEVF